MQVLLHTDPNTDGSHLMADHLTLVVKDAMQRFGGRITRVEAHLSDDNGQTKTSADEIHCMLDARLVGLDAIIVKEQAGNAHQAIEGAVRKLKRAVGAALAKQDPRNRRPALGAAPRADADPDDAGESAPTS